MDITISIRIPEAVVDDLDRVVKANRYMSRSDAVRDYVRRGTRDDLKEVK